MKSSIIYLLFLLLPCYVNAQTKIKGIIKHISDGKGIQGVNVIVKDQQSAILITYALTDAKGAYELNFTKKTDSLIITVSGFNVEKQSKKIANRDQDIAFNLNPTAITLREIKVKPPRIHKIMDTLNYLVEGFRDGSDRTIGDVLKKMPGIEVKADGSILYNNRPINKFYIEQQDLLQGRYGIATNNIEAKDVAAVQVLENHQPVKALKNREFSDDAALNIKLTDEAKGMYIANTKIGAGLSPMLWNNELVAMYFTKGRQSLNTYKGNNTGEDPGIEFRSFYRENNKSNDNFLSVQSPAAPQISQRRYLFNRAHAFSLNNLWAPDKEKQWNANINYLTDRQYKSSSSRSDYFLTADSLLSIEEDLSATEKINQLNASLQLNINKESYYLDNIFSFKGSWHETEGRVIQKDSSDQQLNIPAYSLAHTLNIVKNSKKQSFKIYADNAYTKSPQQLLVSPLLYPELFNPSLSFTGLQQELNTEQFTSNSKLSFGIAGENWKQHYSIGMNVNVHRLQSNLRGIATDIGHPDTPDSLRNDLRWDQYQLFIQPQYTYQINRIRIATNLPLSYNYLQTDNRMNGQKKNLHRIFFNPELSFNYEVNLFLSLIATANYHNKMGEINNTYTGFIMQSYRNLLRNDGDLPEQKNQSYALDLNYRHPLHAIFINFNSRYFHNRMNLLYSYDYRDNLSLRKTYAIPNSTSGIHLRSRLSKGIDAISSTLTIETSYSQSRNAQLTQGRLTKYSNNTYALKPGLQIKLGSRASIQHDFQYVHTKNTIPGQSTELPAIRTYTQQTQMSLFPTKKITISVRNEYYNANVATGANRQMNFADIAAKYKFKTVELAAGYDNIFNAKQYISAAYSDISTYYSAYDLRPAQVILSLRFKLK